MNSSKDRYYRILIYVWACVSAWAVITHLFLPSIIASNWNWGLDRGMQREIALWNIGFLVVILRTLRARIPVTQFLLPGILTLSSLFLINHALSANWGGVILNLIPLCWALIIKYWVTEPSTLREESALLNKS